MKRTKIQYMIVIEIVLALCLGLFVLLNGTGLVPLIYGCGFGVDCAGNVYLGRIRSIDVFQQNQKIRAIPAPTNRGYDFRISTDDVMVLYSGAYLCKLDLDGNYILPWVPMENKPLDSVQEKNVCLKKDGTRYEKSATGRITVWEATDSGRTVIYREPLYQFLLRSLAYLAFLAFFIHTPVLILLFDEKHSSNRNCFAIRSRA